MSKEVSTKIKVYSFVFAFFIALYHTDARDYIPFMRKFVEIFDEIGLTFFFTLSGYFMFRGMKKENIKTRTLKRFKSLLVPYAFWNAVIFIEFYILDPFRMLMRSSEEAVSFGLVMRNIKEVFKAIDPVKVLVRFICQPYADILWYIIALFQFSLLTFIFYLLIKNKSLAPFVMYFMVISTIIVCFLLDYKVVGAVRNGAIGAWIVKIYAYVPMYMLGGIIGYHKSELISTPEKIWPYCLAGFILILALRYVYTQRPDIVENLMPDEAERVLALRIINWSTQFAGPLVIWYSFPDKIFKTNFVVEFICEPSFLLYEMQLCAFWVWQGLLKDRFSIATRERLTFVLGVILIYAFYYAMRAVAPHVLGIATGFRSGKDFKREKKA